MNSEIEEEFKFNQQIKEFAGINTVLDDSFLEEEDKIILFKHLKQLYEAKFEWAAPELVKAFMLSHYKSFIDKMHEDDNIQKYLEEKKVNKKEKTTFEDFFK